MPTDNQPKVSIAMPVYNGDRHICQAPYFLLPTLSIPSLLFLCVLCALCGSFNLIHPSYKHSYILAKIEQNYNSFSTPTLIQRDRKTQLIRLFPKKN